MFLSKQVRSIANKQQANISNQDQVLERERKMRLSVSFISFAVVVSLCFCYGFCATVLANNEKQPGEQELKNNTLLQDLTTDLQRILPVNKSTNKTENDLTSNNNSRLSNQDQLLGDSSDLLSILTSLSNDGILDTMPESQRPDSSPLLSMGQPNGQKSFDDIPLAALASTGQGWGNEKYSLPRTYVSKQKPLHTFDPYFQDDTSPAKQSSNQRMNPIISKRMGNTEMANKKPLKRQQQQQWQQQPTIEPRESKGSQEEVDEFFNEKEPVKGSVDSDELLSRRFAEGDDIYKEDVQVSSNNDIENNRSGKTMSNNNKNRRTLDAAASSGESDEEDDGASGDYDDELEENQQNKRMSSFPSARSFTEGAEYNEKQTRKPLKGIEDSSQLDGRSEASNLKAKKSNPEVELVMQRRNNKKQVAATSASAQSDLSDDEEVSSESHIDKQTDLQAAAGHHHGHSHGHYYQYVEVPKKKAWKMGFKRGNHKHTIMRKEKGYKNKFHSSFKWNAKEKCKKKKKCHSTGKMTWHYEHHDKKKKHHHY